MSIQMIVKKHLKSSLGKLYGPYGDLSKHNEVPLSFLLQDMIIFSDTLHWSDCSLYRDIFTELDHIIDVDVITLFREVSIGHLQRVQLAKRGLLLLRTPGPVPFGTCICFNVETIHSLTCHVYGPFEFRTSLGISILLRMMKNEHIYINIHCITLKHSSCLNTFIFE